MQRELEGKVNEYGFVWAKSAVNAVIRATTYIIDSRAKYVIGLFLDIKGAFDSVWGPAVKENLASFK